MGNLSSTFHNKKRIKFHIVYKKSTVNFWAYWMSMVTFMGHTTKMFESKCMWPNVHSNDFNNSNQTIRKAGDHSVESQKHRDVHKSITVASYCQQVNVAEYNTQTCVWAMSRAPYRLFITSICLLSSVYLSLFCIEVTSTQQQHMGSLWNNNTVTGSTYKD